MTTTRTVTVSHSQWAVWRDLAEYSRGFEPVAVCTSLAAAEAVAGLYERHADSRSFSRRGYWPYIDRHWTTGQRPELAEEREAREAEERRLQQAGEDYHANEHTRTAERIPWEGYPGVENRRR